VANQVTVCFTGVHELMETKKMEVGSRLAIAVRRRLIRSRDASPSGRAGGVTNTAQWIRSK